jgi:hypothetical protein
MLGLLHQGVGWLRCATWLREMKIGKSEEKHFQVPRHEKEIILIWTLN